MSTWSPGSLRSRGATAGSGCAACRGAGSTRCRSRRCVHPRSLRSSARARPTIATRTTSTTWAATSSATTCSSGPHGLTSSSSRLPTPKSSASRGERGGSSGSSRSNPSSRPGSPIRREMSTGGTARSGSTRTRSRRRCSWSVDGRTATATRSCASSRRGRQTRGRSSARGVTAGRITCCPVRTSIGSRARCVGGGIGWRTTTTGSSAIPQSRRSCRTVGVPTSICSIVRGPGWCSMRPTSRRWPARSWDTAIAWRSLGSRRRACTRPCGARMAILPTSLWTSAPKMPPPPRSTGRSSRTCASSVVPSLICACSLRGAMPRSSCGCATSRPTARRRSSPWERDA